MIWFGLGAAVSAIIALVTHLLLPQAEARNPFLAVSERPFDEGELDRIEDIASTSGQLLRECGAKEFFIKHSNGADGVPYSLIRIVPENDLAIHCVFERAASEGYPLHVQMLTNQQAEVY